MSAMGGSSSQFLQHSAVAIRTWLLQELSSILRISLDSIQPSERFRAYGLDSGSATMLLANLGIWLGRSLPVTLAWEYPTIDALASYLASPPNRVGGTQAPGVASATKDHRHTDEPIAIVGIGCRFPGGINSPESFWRSLSKSLDAIQEVPPERWDADAFFDPDQSAAGKMNTRWGGFIEKIDEFDAAFFSISPREANEMDPQQRLALEVAWEALEDVGIVPAGLVGSATGVFIGAMWSDYARLGGGNPQLIGPHTATGQDTSIISARISYSLGLQGPSLTINTACSSSLVAIYLACESLRRGESTLALAGGVSLVASPLSTVAMAKFGAMAPDGRCKAFDERANGYVRGEGVGIVVLKPLSRAVADGSPIYCVLAGGAVNNDGFSNGLTAPNPKAQVDVLRAAYAQTGIDPSQVHYVETHGPGTFLGDPIEAGSLGTVLGQGRPAERALRIGSVKTNIGHTEAAAGVAGLIKVALAMKHRLLPPNLHYVKPNPHISFSSLGLEVQRELGPWPAADGPLIAGINSFGFGGTNCHMIARSVPTSRPHVLPVDAGDLTELRGRVLDLLPSIAEQNTPEEMDGLCRLAASHQGDGAYRLAVVAGSKSELSEQLLRQLANLGAAGEIGKLQTRSRPRIAFVCPGHGAQALGMGQNLMRTEPVFLAQLKACDREIRQIAGWSVLEELAADPVRSRIHEPDIVQPLIFAFQVALGGLWRSWGIEPDALIGHSLGEVTACHLAGVLTLRDAARIICHRSRLALTKAGQGGMLAVALPASEVLGPLGQEVGSLAVGAYNSPQGTVLTGSLRDIERALSHFAERGIRAARVSIEYASHSADMTELADALQRAVQDIWPQPARVRMLSTVQADYVSGSECGPSYWARNLRQPVRFMQGIQKLLDDGIAVFLELSPHPVLGRAIQETATARAQPILTLASGQRNRGERTGILEGIGTLYERGLPVKWPSVLPVGSAPAVKHLPKWLAGNPEPQRPAELGLPGLLTLSAKNPKALRAQVRQYVEHLSAHLEQQLHDINYTASVHRSHFAYRLAAVHRSRTELVEQLNGFLSGQEPPRLLSGTALASQAPKVAFVFPGQGGQWIGMGKHLLVRVPAFRAMVEACDRAMRPLQDWSLLRVLNGEGSEADLLRVDVIQPAVFVMQVGLCALWESWGVRPEAVIGHSMGEVAAAYISGAISLEDACRIVCVRSQLVSRMSGQGGMAIVALPEQSARAAIARYEGLLSIGAINSPQSVLLSGEREALADVVRGLEKDGVFVRLIKVDYASHSAYMDGLGPELQRLLGGVRSNDCTIPLYSTVAGDKWEAGLGPEYWVRNLREPVQFWGAMAALCRDGFDAFVEINPHPALLPAMGEELKGKNPRAVVLNSLRREEGDIGAALEALAALYALGHPVDWSKLHPQGGHVLSLPTYAWQRERHWLELKTRSQQVSRSATGHPLLGSPLKLSTQAGTFVWETQCELPNLPYLRDHRVQDAIVLPMSAYLEMALTAARVMFESKRCQVEGMVLSEALTLVDGEARTIQLVATLDEPDRATFAISSLETRGSKWRLHAKGRLSADASTQSAAGASLQEVRARCAESVAHETCYASLREHQLIYGPAFQGLVHLDLGAGEAIGEIRLPVPAEAAGGAYNIHPALLDACLHVAMFPLLRGAPEPGPAVPTALAALRVYRLPDSRVWSHVQVRAPFLASADCATADLRLLDKEGQVLVELLGLQVQRLERTSTASDRLFLRHEWQLGKGLDAAQPGSPERFLLLADGGGFADALRQRLLQRGAAVVMMRAAELASASAATWDQLMAGSAFTSIVHLSSLEEMRPTALAQTQERDVGSALRLLQATWRAQLRNTPRLWLVTRGVHAVHSNSESVSPSGGSLWGLGRTIAVENPEFLCTRLDLAADGGAEQAMALAQELLAGHREEEIALRDNSRYVGRVVSHPLAGSARETLIPVGSYSFRLQTDGPGVLEHLNLRMMERHPPGYGEVEIAVEAAGTNFIDVMKAMGVYPGQETEGGILGLECAGCIVAVGEGVEGFAIGDEVVAVARGAMASQVTADARMVFRRPSCLTPAQAAAVPIAFATAYHGLYELARLKKGERVLIHSATGGTGLAAVQLALRVGAEVFATAGSPEKRAMLQSLGIEHVMDSRTLDFADEVMQRTQGQGVDVVLNSLTGDGLFKSLTVLAPYGRFIEIGKRDIYQNTSLGLGHFRKKLSYFAVDLAGMLRERTEALAAILQSVMAGLADGTLQPLPVQVFPISQAREVFRTMAQAQHTGKQVLWLRDPQAQLAVTGERGARLRADGTYLITGGLGGLGLSLARGLVERGARHLVLVGRQGAAAGGQQAAVAAIEQMGAHVRVLRADVANREEFEAAWRSLQDGTRPLVRGVIHAAGILEDALLSQMELDQLARVMQPKIIGAWNLHELTLGQPLDFFVLYSSITSLLGSPGQGNYTAANGFLDALARYRRGLGLPGLSINWGPFSRVGLAAMQRNRGTRLENRGMRSLSPAEGNELFFAALGSEGAEIGIAALDLRQWLEFYPQLATSSLLSELVRAAAKQTSINSGDRTLLEALHQAKGDERRKLLEKYVRKQIEHILRITESQLNRESAFQGLGLDSLMGLELRNRLEAGLGLKLSSTLLWTYSNIAQLTTHLLAKLEGDQKVPVAAASPPQEERSAVSALGLDSLSNAELIQLSKELLD